MNWYSLWPTLHLGSIPFGSKIVAMATAVVSIAIVAAAIVAVAGEIAEPQQSCELN